MSNENLEKSEIESKFQGMLRGEFSSDKLANFLAVDIDDCRYLFSLDCDSELAEVYALELHAEYK